MTTESSQAKGKILIVGDLIVDSTWHVNAKKLSPEAPIPTIYLSTPEPVYSPGGASLAASYATKHSMESVFLTVAEDKFHGWLQDKKIDIISLKNSPNIVKTRYIDIESGYHMLRVDNDDMIPPYLVSPFQMRTAIEEIIAKNNIQCITVLDYVKGVFGCPDTCHSVISIAERNNIPIYVDTRGNTLNFVDVDYLKLNEKEFTAACTALHINSPLKLAKRLHIECLVVTKGKKGASLYLTEEEKEYQFVSSLTNYIGTPDVTGCGDVFDINFCYNRFIECFSPTKSLRLSVEQATKFAYEPVDNRL